MAWAKYGYASVPMDNWTVAWRSSCLTSTGHVPILPHDLPASGRFYPPSNTPISRDCMTRVSPPTASRTWWYGGAQKLAVAKMVQRLLHLEELPDPDAADALAIALAHGQESSRLALSRPKQI